MYKKNQWYDEQTSRNCTNGASLVNYVATLNFSTQLLELIAYLFQVMYSLKSQKCLTELGFNILLEAKSVLYY